MTAPSLLPRVLYRPLLCSHCSAKAVELNRVVRARTGLAGAMLWHSHTSARVRTAQSRPVLVHCS